MKVTELVESFAKPIVEAHGCSLWDVEYVKEAGTRYLRVFIDREGGVSVIESYLRQFLTTQSGVE